MIVVIEVQRSIQIKNLLGVTKSSNNDEFVLHVQDEYSYRFNSELRKELFQCLKQIYFLITKKNLPVYEVVGTLKDYANSQKDVQKGITRIPPSVYRLIDEDDYEEDPGRLDLFELESKTIFAPPGKESVELKDFEIKSVVGRGSFGKVFLVCLRNNQSEVFAMKSMEKNVILEYE